MEYKITDVVMVDVECDKCGQESQSPTFKQLLEQEDKPLGQMYKAYGRIYKTCDTCLDAQV